MLIAAEVKRIRTIKFSSQCPTSETFIIYSTQTIHKHFILDLQSEAASGRSDSLMREATIEINTRKDTWIWDIQKKLKTYKAHLRLFCVTFSLAIVILSSM